MTNNVKLETSLTCKHTNKISWCHWLNPIPNPSVRIPRCPFFPHHGWLRIQLQRARSIGACCVISKSSDYKDVQKRILTNFKMVSDEFSMYGSKYQ